MDEEIEYEGKWWVPENLEEKVSGILSLLFMEGES